MSSGLPRLLSFTRMRLVFTTHLALCTSTVCMKLVKKTLQISGWSMAFALDITRRVTGSEVWSLCNGGYWQCQRMSPGPSAERRRLRFSQSDLKSETGLNQLRIAFSVPFLFSLVPS